MTKKSFSIESIPFTKKINEGNDVILVGFYDNDSSQKTYENRISGYQSSEHTYELQNHLTNGLSGSPVLLDGKICGVAKAINIKKNLTYVIPITELCMETEDFFKEKKVEKKKLSLEQWASVATIGATLIALVAWLIPPFTETTTITTKNQTVSKEEIQSKQVLKGNVTDMKGEPLLRVRVWESKMGSIVKSDVEGYYIFNGIEAKEGEELKVKFRKEGYFRKELIQQLGEEYNVSLQKKVD